MSANIVSLENSVFHNEKLRNDLKNHYFAELDISDLPAEYYGTWVKWKAIATRMSYKGPFVWLVRPGFSISETAPAIGPCFGDFKILKSGSYLDEPTRESIVFWIPGTIPGTEYKFIKSQKAILDLYRSDFELPPHHLCSFGSASLVSGLMLNYLRLTGKRVPAGKFIRTSTVTTGGLRFSLGWFDQELFFEVWREDSQRFPNLGIFPIGIEQIWLPSLD